MSWKVVPAINQVELHPFLPQHDLVKYCHDQGILMEAYSSLGSTNSPIMSDSEIKDLAEKSNTTPATLLISYQVNKGIIVLPKSVSADRIASNLKVIKLSDEVMAQLDGTAAKGKAMRGNTPKWGSDLGYDDWYAPVKSAA